MLALLTTLHVTAAAIVVGVLFLQSLALLMALRLAGEAQRTGVRLLQTRIHRYVYYPMLALAVLAGFANAWANDAFSQGRWLHWKLVLVVLLAGLGLLTGRNLRAQRVARLLGMLVHVLIFFVSAAIVFLAVLKPF
jgi:uncharacterized membrane protein